MESDHTASQQPDDSPPESTHRCARCGGLLVLTYYQDLLEDSGETTIPAMRCAICGEIIDSVILANRQLPAPNLLYGTKQRKYGRQIVPMDAPRTGSPDPAEGADDSDEWSNGAED